MANVPQVFSIGLGLSQESSAPTAFNGLVYYDSTRNSFRHYVNGSWIDVSSQSAVTTDANLDSSHFTAAVVSSSLIRISGQSAARSIFGLTASAAGKKVIISNASSFILTIANQSASEGTAANKIITDTGADVSLVSGATATLVYDTTSSRWRLLTSGIGAIVNGGNAFGASMTVGTTDAQSLILKTNNTAVLTLEQGGRILGSSSIDRSLATTQDSNGSSTYYIESGTFSPTITAISNVTSVTTPGFMYWMRVGRTVTCWGQFDMVGTLASVLTMALIQLPVSSLLALNTEAHGSMARVGTGTNLGSIVAYATGTAVRTEFILAADAAGSSRTFGYHFSYYCN